MAEVNGKEEKESKKNTKKEGKEVEENVRKKERKKERKKVEENNSRMPTTQFIWHFWGGICVCLL